MKIIIPYVDPNHTVDVLADLLSTAWLSESHMDAFAGYLNSSTSSNWFVANVYFASRLPFVSQLTAEEVATEETLVGVKREMEDRRATRLLFPVNLKNTHWIIFHVDTEQKTVSYGEHSIP